MTAARLPSEFLFEFASCQRLIFWDNSCLVCSVIQIGYHPGSSMDSSQRFGFYVPYASGGLMVKAIKDGAIKDFNDSNPSQDGIMFGYGS